MAKSLQNMADIWQKAGLVQRIMLLAVILACVGAAGLLFKWAWQPQMSLLYSGVAPEEAEAAADLSQGTEGQRKGKPGNEQA